MISLRHIGSSFAAAAQRWHLPTAGGALLFVLALLRLWDPAPIEALRLQAFDIFQRLAPRSVETPAVLIVDIDEKSLDRLGQWPWPRALIADLIDRIGEGDPKAIGFDIHFVEPDRLSPDSLAVQLRGLTPEMTAALAALPSGDARLAASIAGGKVVLPLAGLRQPGPEPSHIAPAAIIGQSPLPFLPGFGSALVNLDSLEASAAGLGSVTLTPGSDGIVRQIPLIVRISDKIVPSLGLEMLRVAAAKQSYMIRTGDVGIENVIAGATIVNTDAHGQLILRYQTHDPRRFISAAALLDGKIDPDIFRDRFVLVGASATGLWDWRATPLGEILPGVEIQAQALETMLTGEYLERPPTMLVAELLAMLLGGLIVFATLSRIRPGLTPIIPVLLGLGLNSGAWIAFRDAGYLVDPTYPTVAIALIYLVQLYAGHATVERSRRRVTQAFAQYLSPDLVRRLVHAPEPPKLGGEHREMTIMFADVRGFTALSERLRHEPERLTRLINRLLTPVSEVVLTHNGTIDKYIGDCLMAFWNAPLDDPDQASNACAAALGMQQAIAELNLELAAEAALSTPSGVTPAYIHLQMGIGLATGDCIVGNMGSLHRFNYSVLGDPVNVAARLEAETKSHGVGIIIGEETRAMAPGFATLPLGGATLKGRGEEKRVHSLIGDETLAVSAEFQLLQQHHDRLLEALEAGDARAAERAAGDCLALKPELEGLYTYLLMRDWAKAA